MVSKKIRIALVILENQAGEFALQLRSPIPNIVYPDQWGSFGGHIEENEDPNEAALREIEEELSVALDPDKLIFHTNFEMGNEKEYSIFHYLVTSELDHAVLMEGEDYSFFTAAEIKKGKKKDKRMVGYYRDLLLEIILSKPKD